MKARAYLDHNASSPLRPEAREAMLEVLSEAGNPSSVHWHGRAARARIDSAREVIAAFVGTSQDSVVFTSGGTEANNMVLAAGWDAVLVSGIEHESVLAPAKALTPAARVIPVLESGAIDLDALDRALAEVAGDAGDARILLSLQAVNNETGVIQPVAEAVALARARGAAVHTDAVQAAAKIRLDMTVLGVDYLSLSAHKFGGPTGTGALVAREGSRRPPLVRGGGQERRARAGTENVAGIAGFASAVACVREAPDWVARTARLRQRLEAGIRDITPNARIVAEKAARVMNTSCVAVPEAHAETLVIALDLAGVSVSAGSACSSGKVAESHVLRAMGLGPELAKAAVRVSLGWNSTDTDVDRFLGAWAHIHERDSRDRVGPRDQGPARLAL